MKTEVKRPILVIAGATLSVLGALWALIDPAGLVLAAAGVLLLLWHHLRPPVAATVAGTLAGAAAGLSASLWVRSEQVCCMFGYTEHRGWPYAWSERGGVADTEAEARALAQAGGWTTNGYHLAADLAFWAAAGFLIAVLAGAAWRRWRERAAR
ncbi:hypothetical protein [Actinoplanes sp. NPDC051851]|uniref:hypothetical protein n=1 Tax=Actinoplanes sp. NPDC051851 TaxID=3154753 RepID=UPI003445BE77